MEALNSEKTLEGCLAALRSTSQQELAQMATGEWDTTPLFAIQMAYVRSEPPLDQLQQVHKSLIDRHGAKSVVAPIAMAVAERDLASGKNVAEHSATLGKLDVHFLKSTSPEAFAKLLLLQSKCQLFSESVAMAEKTLSRALALNLDSPVSLWDLQADIFFINSKLQDSLRVRLQVLNHIKPTNSLYHRTVHSIVLTLLLLPLSRTKSNIMRDVYAKISGDLTPTERAIFQNTLLGRLVARIEIEKYVETDLSRSLPVYYGVTHTDPTSVQNQLQESTFEENVACIASSFSNVSVAELAQICELSTTMEPQVEAYLLNMILTKRLDAHIDGLTNRIHFKHETPANSDVSHITEFFIRYK